LLHAGGAEIPALKRWAIIVASLAGRGIGWGYRTQCERKEGCRPIRGRPDGETVVALLDDGEATLKKFYKERTRIRLQPANENFDPIYVDRVEIQGIVTGVVRLV
jgi:hypothetical protein